MADAPKLLSLPRLATLITSLLVALSSGTNYLTPVNLIAYAPQLGSRLHLTHTQLNLIALSGNVGVYTSGPFWGKLVDARGPRVLLVGAFVFLLAGYSGIRGVYDAGLDEGERLSNLHLSFMIFCGFLTGLGGNAGLTSAINSTAKSFPDKLRATAVAVVLSGFGLSAFFFTSISHIFFPGNTSQFLLILALGTSLPMILGFLFIRPIPLPAMDSARALEHGSADQYQRLSTSERSVTFQRLNNSQTHLLSSTGEDSEDEDVSHPSPSSHRHGHASIALMNSVELSPSVSIDGFRSIHRSRSRSVVPSERGGAEKTAEGRGVDISGRALWFSGDFWLIFSILMLLSGTGLMYINNVGSISQALFAKGNPSYDEVEAAAFQAAQVSVISITNFIGRIFIGVAADFAKSALHYPRSFCMTLVASLFVLSQAVTVGLDDVRRLWQASALLGFAYGSMFGLFPTVCIEWFGLGMRTSSLAHVPYPSSAFPPAHFSENWGYVSLSPVIGGNLFFAGLWP
ncbi:hypothetical protein EW146_g3249 [Bondarzewia mesenterica]|uniref:Nodulin-like domain-containing protein n=1 Tax=Bondarzewia mesenterica TaxID=1095465 RepID=A0A4S4LY81_9AGAM|nr:hypothetical protein EW146_g3249 [Bondarzewia mesenterica]